MKKIEKQIIDNSFLVVYLDYSQSLYIRNTLFIKEKNPLHINLFIHRIYVTPCSISVYTDKLEGFCKNFQFAMNKRDDNTINNIVFYKN